MEGADEEEMVLATKENKRKWKLHMDPKIGTLWPHKGYSVSMEEDVFVTISSSACTNEPSGEDLCTGCVAVTEKVLKNEDEILTG